MDQDTGHMDHSRRNDCQERESGENMKKRKITYRKVDELIPYEDNPRHNDDAVKKVAESISQFGFNVPVVIDGNDIIIAGHTRLKACKQLGIQEIPTIIADDLTPEQVKAYRLIDNKVGEFSSWDWETLDKELDEISKFDFDFQMSDFGFFDNDFDESLLDDLFEANTEEKVKEDKFITCPNCGHEFKEN